MALNATIYKITVYVNDFNESRYETLSLTIALHPSETLVRMFARVLAYCFHASDRLEFTKGLSTPECPDIWEKNLQGDIVKWIEVGEPGVDKIKKACRRAGQVWVYSFNSKSPIWWQQNNQAFSELPVKVVQLENEPLQVFSNIVSRNMSLSISIVDNEITLDNEAATCSLKFDVLKE